MHGILRTLLFLWVAVPIVIRAESTDAKLDAFVTERIMRLQKLALDSHDEAGKAAVDEEIESIIRDLLLPPPEIVELLQDEIAQPEASSSANLQVIGDVSDAFLDDPGIIMLSAQLDQLLSDPSGVSGTVLKECLEMTRDQIAYYLEGEFVRDDAPAQALGKHVKIASALIESRGILDVHATMFEGADIGRLAPDDSYLIGFAASRSGFLDLAAYYLLVALRDSPGPQPKILNELRFVCRRMTGWKVDRFDLAFFVWRCERHLAKGEYEFVMNLIKNAETSMPFSAEARAWIVSLKTRCLRGLKRFDDVVACVAEFESTTGGMAPEHVVRLCRLAEKNIEFGRIRSRALAKAEAGQHAEAAKLFEQLWGEGKAEVRDAILGVKHHVLAGNPTKGAELGQSALTFARGANGGKHGVYVTLLEGVVAQSLALSEAKISLDKAIAAKPLTQAESGSSPKPSGSSPKPTRPSRPSASSLADEFLRRTK